MTRLVLEIDFSSEPIAGTLEENGGAQHPFVGWIGLSELLGRIRRIEDDSSAQSRAGAGEPSPHSSIKEDSS